MHFRGGQIIGSDTLDKQVLFMGNFICLTNSTGIKKTFTLLTCLLAIQVFF